MKTIGFIDYFLDEWHANHYPPMIEEYNKEHGTDYVLKYAWGEIDAPIEGRVSNAVWCENVGVELCASIEEVCAKADCILVLAPSNPELHLGYAEQVFRCGKDAYIDKTFAPDLATAKQIYALAEQYGVKFFTSSALRYAEELEPYVGKTTAVSVTGGGSNLDEYIIHQVEMAVKLYGAGAEKLRVECCADQAHICIAYPDGKTANLFYAPCMAFTVTVSTAEQNAVHLPIQSPYFENLIADILRFHETKTLSFDGAETLEVMRIREAVIRGKDSNGVWIALGN